MAQFEKGRSGNPGGRSKSAALIARYIREKTEQGCELADHLLGIVRDVQNDPKVRVSALHELLDRCVGKAPQTIEIGEAESDAPQVNWSLVSLEDRKRLLAAMDEVGRLAALSSADESSEH